MIKACKDFFLIGLVFVLAFAPIARGAVRLWSITPVLLIIYFLIFLWLFKIVNIKDRQDTPVPLRGQSLAMPIAFFAILAIASFIFSVYKHDSFYALLKLFGYIGMYYLIVNEFDHDMKRKLAWLIISIGTVLSAYGILQYLGLLPHGWWFPQEFLASTYVNHNHFAGYLELVIPLAIAMLLRAKFIVMPILVIMITAFILTQSRGAWFGLSVSLAAMFVLFVKTGSIKRKNLIVVLLLVIIAVSFISFGKEVISDRLSALDKTEDGHGSMSTRLLIWRGTVKLIANNPLAGCGIGNFVWAFPRFRPEGLDVQANFAHNDYLEMAAEMGIAAPIIFVWMVVIVIRNAVRRERIDYLRLGCAAGILSLSLHGLVDFNFHIPANMLLFTICAAIAMSPSHSGEERR